MSEYIVPSESLICFRRGGPRQHSEPMVRATVSSVKTQDAGLAAHDFVLIACAAVIIGVLGLLCLVQASEITAISYRVHQARAEVNRLEQENSVLAVEIAELERLDRVEREAEALGFTHSPTLHYLHVEPREAVLAETASPQP